MRSWVPLVLAAWAACAAASECYYADGSRPTDYDYQPCGDTKTTFSTCCYFGEGDVCLENGLCSQPDKHEYYRAACANKDWSNCPHVCMDEDSNNWLAVEKCGENKYCCPSSGDGCCTNGAKIYTLSIPDSSNSTSESASASGDGASSTASSDAEPSSTAGSGGKSAPVGAIAGGVVGGVAVIGFLLVGFCCFKRRGKKKAAATPLVGNGASGNANGSSQQLNQSSPGEVEGGLGKPGNGGAGFDEKKGYYTQTTPVSGHGVQHSRQQRLMEMEGSAGKVFTEADSKPVTGTGYDGMNGYYTQSSPGSDYQLQQQSGGVTTNTNGDGNSGHYTQNSLPNSHFQQSHQQGVVGTGSDGTNGHHTQTNTVPNHHFQQAQHHSGMSIVGAGFNEKKEYYPQTTPSPDHQHQQHQHQQHQHRQHHQQQSTGMNERNNTQTDQAPHHHYQQPGHQGLSEAVGSSGTVFTEVDSKPATSGVNAPYTQTSPVLSHQYQQAQQQTGDSVLRTGLGQNMANHALSPNHQFQQQSLSEAEGSQGKVFTEADSKAITSPATDHRKTHHAQVVSTPVHQSQQQGLTEIEGSQAKVFTEADSKPVIAASTAHSEGDHEQRLPGSAPYHQSQQGVTEVEGSSGKVFAEADSSPIPDAHSQEKSSSGQTVSSLVPQLQQTQRQYLAEVEGSQGKVFTEADSKPVVPASTQEKTSYTQSLSGSAPYHNSQQGATEVEGSSGTVFSEVDSTPIDGQTLPSPLSRPQQHGVTEMEGSSGRVFTEADSKPITTNSQENTSYTRSIPSPGQHQQSQQQGVTEVEGSLGKVFTEADSTPVAPASTQTQQFQQFQQFQAFQQTQQTQERAVAEVQGSAGNVFTEADSKPVSRSVFDEKNAHKMPAAAVTMKQFEQFQKFQQFQQRAAAEVEGSAGKVFSEADSTPINPPGFDEKKAHEMPAAPASMQQFEQFQLFQRFQQAQQQYLAEVEGNLGKVFTEADSRPVVLADPEKNASYVESVSVPEQRKPRSHEMAS